MVCQLRAPTKEVFHNRPGHLITFQTELAFVAVILGNPHRDELLALYFNATSIYSSPLFFPPLGFKEVILSSIIHQRPCGFVTK